MGSLSFDPAKPPVSCLALISNGADDHGITLNPKPAQEQAELHLKSGESFVGSALIIRYLARRHRDQLLYGDSPLTSTQVDFFIELSHALSNKDTLSHYAQLLNTHLSSRTVLVGNSITIADLIVYEHLSYNLRWQAFQKEASNYPHLFRWFRYLSSSDAYGSALSQVMQLAEAKKKQFYEQSKSGSFALDVIKKGEKVITRFPPEPSGYLHIGHAKAAMLNYHYAKEYNGELIVRFDDTNPSKEKDEYVEAILSDIATLGIEYQKLTYTSDYFDLLLELCEKLIRDGNGYVDDTPVEQMRKERMDGIPSKARNRSIQENLDLFNEMKLGSPIGLKCVVRGKIDMSAKNKTMRDPTFYRCKIDIPHHRTGTKYKVYPTYDFCCPIVDSIENVTHVMRTIEYRDRNEQYMWVLDALGLRKPVIRDYSRLNFVYTLMSKRKLQWFVDTGKVEGWYDPRFPTVQGIVRRGMTIEAIREFMRLQGFSISVNYMEWDKIWTINKKIIDPIAHRYTAIAAIDRVPFKLTNVSDGITYHTTQLHPKDASIGFKVVARSNIVYLEQDDAKLCVNGEEITLMQWGNAIIETIQKDSNGTVIGMSGRLHLEGDVKKTDKKLTWIGGEEGDFVKINLVEFDHLITIPKLEEDGPELAEVVRTPSRFDTPALGEQALRNVQKGQTIQLNRRGFFRCDEIVGATGGKPMQLFLIPDGKQKAMSTLGTHTKADKTVAAAANKSP